MTLVYSVIQHPAFELHSSLSLMISKQIYVAHDESENIYDKARRDIAIPLDFISIVNIHVRRCVQTSLTA